MTLMLLLVASALAGADGDGFTVADGDCDDLDPNIYPGAPELCDGFDNDCTEVQVIAVTPIMTLGNGNAGESLTWNQADRLWYHTSGTFNGQEYLEPIDIDSFTILPNLPIGNTYGPDSSNELMGIVWYPPLSRFIVINNSGDVFHVSPTGDFTNLNVFGGGGTGWWGAGPNARGYAVVGNLIYGTENNNSNLYSFDPATGVNLSVVPLFIDGQLGTGCTALTHHPVRGSVWGICRNPAAGFNSARLLVEIDVATGIGISRGNTGQRLAGLGIDDLGRILAVSEDNNNLGQSETIYEIILSEGGGPQPGELDMDGDGYLACEECNDAQVLVYPGAPEICDGFDSDCDGSLPLDEEDTDGDGQSICDGDCDDLDPLTAQGRPEQCDGVDNNCDGAPDVNEVDVDGDGQRACEECNDDNPDIYRGAPELCDGLDNDCNGQIPPSEMDNDGDGSRRCVDCDDNDRNNAPDQEELCDGYDNDCDGAPGPNESDADGDGIRGCAGDCDDADAAIYPNAPETEGDGIDQDCDGTDQVSEPKGTEGDDDEERCGCSTQSSPTGMFAVLTLGLIALRRRRH